jgi:hypothetical protein
MNIQTLHVVDIHIPHCPLCYETNMSWFEASQLVPKRPLADEVESLFDGKAINAEIRAALIKAGFKVSPSDKQSKTNYEKALDL